MRLMFVMPAHGRVNLTRVCLYQLSRVIAQLGHADIPAGAVVIAEDANFKTAEDCGLDAIRRSNDELGRRWNDGYQYAAQVCGATHVVPIGSDDWIEAEWLICASRRPKTLASSIMAPRLWMSVDEFGDSSADMVMTHPGGLGVRLIPVGLLEPLGFRPCIEHRNGGIDMTTWRRIRDANGGDLPVVYHDHGPLQVIDWKGGDTQINSFRDSALWRSGEIGEIDWDKIAMVHGAMGVEDMREFYASKTAAMEAA